MPNLTAVVTSYFPTASETYSNNINATIAAGAASVPVNAASTYIDGDIVVLTVDPGLAAQATFIGVKASTPDRFINCFWTEGNTAVGHSNGAVITDYDSATHYSVVTKGIRQFANNDGTLKTTAVQAALNLGSASLNGFNALGYAPNTVTANGNRSYTLLFNAVDLSATLSPGMRLRTTRSVLAPTQSSLLNGTNQSWSRITTINGMTFVNNFVVSAWVKLSSYANSTVASRMNGTSGWKMQVQSTGQLNLTGYNGGGANYSQVLSNQSIPLNKWIHIAAQLDMATFTATPTTSYIMFDGVDLPSTVARGGTLPTALIQAGNLEIGSYNGGLEPLPGRIAQVAIYSTKITQAIINASKDQGLAGTETGLISAYSFSGNGNDLNATNINHLTANNGAVATTADSPYGVQANGTISSTLDYAIIQSVVFSTNTTVVVQVPEGCTIPTSGGVASVAYSSNKSPYGFPTQRGKWQIELSHKIVSSTAGPANSTWYNTGGLNLVVPVGEWRLEYQALLLGDRGVSGALEIRATLSTANNTESDPESTTYIQVSSGTQMGHRVYAYQYKTISVATPVYLNMMQTTTMSNLYLASNDAPAIIRAENAYL